MLQPCLCPAEAPWLDLILGSLEGLRFPQPQSPPSPMYNSKTLARPLLQLNSLDSMRADTYAMYLRKYIEDHRVLRHAMIIKSADSLIVPSQRLKPTNSHTTNICPEQRIPPTTCFALASFAPRTGPPFCMGTNQLLHQQRPQHRTAFTPIDSFALANLFQPLFFRSVICEYSLPLFSNYLLSSLPEQTILIYQRFSNIEGLWRPLFFIRFFV